MMMEDGVATAITTLYSNSACSPALVTRLCEARSDGLVPFTRGLTSHIYRLRINEDEGKGTGNTERQQYCLKRVMEEDEVPPHSIRREMMCYRMIDKERRKSALDIPIINILSAIRDESDPFSVAVDLIMPLYPCTLEEVMNESVMQLSVGKENDGEVAGFRPSLQLAQDVQSASLPAFIQSTTLALFSALSFLHRHSIAHRDIKPSNILVDAHALSIVLIDFGTCYLKQYQEGDDGRGGITSEVGTGAYRAPESLFSPLKGYDVFKLDVWQAGVTLAQFFLPLRKVEVVTAKKAERQIGAFTGNDHCDTSDDRQEWEKALWADDAGASWAKLEDVWSSNDRYDSEEDEDDVDREESMSGWKRETLFDASRGDLGLANSIFDLLGLPQTSQDWPEADQYQPNLDRMPFARRLPAAGGLHQRLCSSTLSPTLVSIIDVLHQCIQLSPSKRLRANEATTRLQHSNQT